MCLISLSGSILPIRVSPRGDSITGCFAKPQQSDAMDDYLGHIEYSEVTNWQRLFEDTYPQGWYSYIKDQVGTIYKVWDQNTKQIVDNRTYDSFGNLISQAGTTKTPLGFQGKYYDAESGLNYFYHRYYNPAIGRFVSEDIIKVDSNPDKNLYFFVKNNSINLTDPRGLSPENSTNNPFEPGECCSEKNEIKKRIELVDWLIKYYKNRPADNPTFGPNGMPLVTLGSSSGFRMPGLSKCIAHCRDIHESVPSHTNPGSMSLGASEVQAYIYEKWCLEYELGSVNYWNWPF
jgi:RHS repeat-associated protein